MADAQNLKEKAAKGLLWGGISTGGQQVLSLFFGIYLARILTSEDYGLFNMLIVFTSLATLLQESGFIVALINKKEATHKDYNAIFWFSCCMGATLYIIGFLTAPLIADFYHAPELVAGARVLFLWFLVCCTCTVHNAILVKKLMIKERTKADLTAFTVSCIVGIIMARQGMGYWSLITQMVVQGIVNTLIRWHYSPWRPTLSFSIQPLKEFFPFSVKLLLTGLFNVVNNNIFSILLGRFYTKSQTGYYAQGYKWGYIAYSVIWGMLNSVSQPVLAQVAQNPAQQQFVLRKLIRFTAFITCPAMLGLAFIAPEFITVTVTDKWAASTPFMQLFCIWGLIIPINNLCTNTIISCGKSNIYMYGTIALDIVQLTTIYLLAPYGLYQMIMGYIAVNFIWFLVWNFFLKRLMPIQTSQLIFRDIFPFLILSAVSIGIAYLTTGEIENVYLRLLGKICIVAICYAILLYFSGAVIFRETLQFFQKFLHRQS